MYTEEYLEAARRYHRERDQKLKAEREAERQKWLEKTRSAIQQIAPHHPFIQTVYLYGSLMQPGRFGTHSDLDLAVECDAIEAETPFWQDLEQALRRDVDLRPLVHPITFAVEFYGELAYERQENLSHQRAPERY